MSENALITGATGFVGSHLVPHLASQGWKLRALVRPTSDTRLLERHGVDLHRGDLGDADAIRGAASGVDVVFHLAAVTGLRGDTDFVRANVEGTRRVVEAIASADPRPRRLVYLSSYAACGPAGERPRTLRDPPAPLTVYGRTKLGGEEAALELRSAGLEVVVVRAPAVYGPGDHAFLPYFRLVQRRLAPAPTGERRLHLIYAPDLARALARAADVPPGTYPVADPEVHSWDDIVQEISRVLERRPVRLPLPPALVRVAAAATEGVGSWLGREVVFNREKAEEMLASGWVCDLTDSEALLPAGDVTTLDVGVAATARWYKNQGWI